MRYFLGVDIGNTKSHGLVITEAGEAVGFTETGPGNHEVLGAEGFRQTLHQAVDGAIASAGITKADIAGAGYGVAGYDWPSDRALMDEMIGSLGIDTPYNVINDGMMGLIVGAKQGWGVCVSAGTSSNARGRDLHGNTGRVTGNGWYFGELGGGHELVFFSMGAISRAWSLRGPQTILSELYVAHFGAKDVTDLLEGVARGRYHAGATLAPVTFAAAKQGDAVAQDLILQIAQGLGNLAVGIIRQLHFEALDFEVVLAGSFYKGSETIEPVMREVIHAVAPGARLVPLNAPPVTGPALLGMEAAGLEITPVRARLVETASRFET